MIDMATRRRLVDLSIVATSVIVLGGGILVVAQVDRSRPKSPVVPESASTTLVTPVSTMSVLAPAAGLEPAPRPARRVIVVRRSRAS